MIIREERAGDHARVDAIHREAFGQDAEARLVAALRTAGAAKISLVAELDGVPGGHILFSPVVAEQGDVRILGLAPMAVLPVQQRRGMGSALIRRGLHEALQAGYAAVVVLGHPDYYPRFGFRPAHEFGIRCVYNAPLEAFMALELRPGALSTVSGVVHYHDTFRMFE